MTAFCRFCLIDSVKTVSREGFRQEANAFANLAIEQKGGEKASRECPECHSKRKWKAGVRQTLNGEVQRFLCRACGFRFSAKSNIESEMNKGRQLCAIFEEAKKLGTTTEIKTVAGDTILEYIRTLRRKQKKPRTIKMRVYYLEKLKQNGADLSNPASVENVLADIKLTTAQQYNAVAAYKSYCKIFKIQWDDPPKINYQPKRTFVPTKEELETLIHAAGRRTATFLQVAYTTGARVGEICQIKYADVNVKASTIDINHPEKGSKPRTIPVPEKTIAMINGLPRKYGEYVFNPKPDSIRSNLVYLRKKIASIHRNERFKRIHMHTFRHFYARKKLRESMGNKTYVQYLLGHKSILSTERYTELEEYKVDQKYQSAVSMTLKDAQKLIEDGYTYVCDFKGHPLFRKVV